MAFTTGPEGRISAAGASTDLGYLINTASKPYNASITLTAEVFDATGFASTAPISTNSIHGQNMWTGSFAGKFPQGSPASGHEGFIIFAAGYLEGAHSWTVSATAAALDHSGFASTPDTWKDFDPGLYSYSGSFLVRASDDTALGGIVSGAATFRINKESTNDNTLVASNILISNRSAPFDVNGVSVIQYDFVVDGVLSFDGDNALFDVDSAGTPDPMERPQKETITLRSDAAGNRTLSGSAFLTSWTIGATLGSPVEVSAGFQGTGALTDA